MCRLLMTRLCGFTLRRWLPFWEELRCLNGTCSLTDLGNPKEADKSKLSEIAEVNEKQQTVKASTSHDIIVTDWLPLKRGGES